MIKIYYQINKEKIQKYKKQWAKKNRKIIKKKRHIRYLKHKSKENLNAKKYYIRYKVKILKYQEQYNKIHKLNKKEYDTKYRKMKWKTDLNYRLKKTISTRIRIAIKLKSKKSIKTRFLLGCSIKKVRIYLEQKFIKKMNWNNYGKYWEIDHIKPCSSFDLTKIKEQKKCFHYKNLQPLTITENRSKFNHE